ncbi:MAG TPA: hypothetical protein VGA98_00285, partial [Allosphingosinicella sp.]
MGALLKWSVLGLALLALIVVPFLLLEPDVGRLVKDLFGSGGQPGLVLALAIVVLLAFDVVLPIPSSLVSVAAVVLFGWLGGVLIWLGMTVGCGLGYWL